MVYFLQSTETKSLYLVNRALLITWTNFDVFSADVLLTLGATCVRTCAYTLWKNHSLANFATNVLANHQP